MARVPEILIVEQDPKLRYEIKQLIRQSELAVAGEASFGTEAVSLASEKGPDAIVCGISVPADRSLKTIEAMLDVLPETPVIAYGWKTDLDTVRQAVLVGARDFLAMPAQPEQLLESIRGVLEAEERKRLRMSGQTRGLGASGMTIAVFGAKGGVGKSTISVNLGCALASLLRQAVVLVDADTSFGDVASMLDLKADRSIVELAREVDGVDRESVTNYLVQHDSGLFVLPAPQQPLFWRSITPDRLRAVIALLARRFDIVLIDTSAMLSDLSLAILEDVSTVLWVTSTDFSSINNSQRGLQTLEQLSFPDGKIRLVLNVTDSEDGVRPAKIEEALERSFFWSIPYDRQVRAGGQIGQPAVVRSAGAPGARRTIELAEALTGIAPQAQPRNGKKLRLFSRKREAAAPAATEGGVV